MTLLTRKGFPNIIYSFSLLLRPRHLNQILIQFVYSVKGDDDDRHPEKRMKAAYKAFEAENMKRIKAENPTMRMSQWKQILHKDWTKSPENPINA